MGQKFSIDIRLLDFDRELLLLRYKRYRDGWNVYDVEFAGVSEKDWIEKVAIEDPRDIPFQWEVGNGVRYPFVYFADGYRKTSREFFIRWNGFYSTRRRGLWVSLKRVLKMDAGDVAQERAPMTWNLLNRRDVLRLLKSATMSDAALALMQFSSKLVRTCDVEWAAGILLGYIHNASQQLDHIAINGLRELARVNGYSNETITNEVEAVMRETTDDAVRRAAQQALKDIRRFGNLR